MTEPPLQTASTSAPSTAPVRNLELKAALLLLLLALLVCGSFFYLLYARGAFEATQRLVLLADDSEGVVVGMDVTFSGFPVGRVQRIELSDEGNVRILVDVPRTDARWLRTSSVFTLERGLVGNTRIRAFSGILKDPILPDGAVRTLLVGDATAEIPKLVTAARQLIDQLKGLTGADSAFSASLGNVQTVTERLKGPSGALGVLFGNDADAKKLVATIERTNTLLARLDSVMGKVDGLAAKADTQVFGAGGVMPATKATVDQLNALLLDARNSLKKVDAVLIEAQAVGANTRVATADLGVLRAEVEASLRKVEHLVNEVNKKWPFSRDTEIKLP